MILTDKIDKFDKSQKAILYEKDESQNCVPVSKTLYLAGDNDLGDEYYYTRAVELERLIEELKSGKISPIKLFIDHLTMDERDMAHRMRIPYRKLKKHLTIEGFKKINIETLEKYAKIFDITLADFFQVIKMTSGKVTSEERYHDRLFQYLTIK